MTNIPVSILSC